MIRRRCVCAFEEKKEERGERMFCDGARSDVGEDRGTIKDVNLEDSQPVFPTMGYFKGKKGSAR